MTTIALEGTGASIAFGTSSFTNDLISLTLPEKVREAIETTHLGTTGGKTFKPAKLKNVGVIQAEFDHNPAQADLLDGQPEQITINYPLLSGQTTPAKLQFTGFVTQQGGEEFRVDARMVTKVSMQVSGDLTYIAPT